MPSDADGRQFGASKNLGVPLEGVNRGNAGIYLVLGLPAIRGTMC